MAKQQPWQCDACSQSGTVEYEQGVDSDVLAVAAKILADHRRVSPSCDAGWHEIRVQNMSYRPPAEQD